MSLFLKIKKFDNSFDLKNSLFMKIDDNIIPLDNKIMTTGTFCIGIYDHWILDNVTEKDIYFIRTLEDNILLTRLLQVLGYNFELTKGYFCGNTKWMNTFYTNPTINISFRMMQSYYKNDDINNFDNWFGK